MIAVDTNLLVYAHREDSPWHAASAEWLVSVAEGPVPWAIPWPCIHEFLAIVTHPRIYRPPTPRELAVEQVEAWLEAPSLVLLGETEGYWPALRATVLDGGAIGSHGPYADMLPCSQIRWRRRLPRLLLESTTHNTNPRATALIFESR